MLFSPYRSKVAAVAIFLLTLFAAMPVTAAPDSKPKLSPAKRERLVKLLENFGRTRSDVDARRNTVDSILRIAAPAPLQLQKAIEKELQPQSKTYAADFSSAAQSLLKKRTGQINLDRVAKLQETFLKYARQEGLTKDQIKKHSEPALSELESMAISITANDVLSSSPELAQFRQRLLTLGGFWNRCQLVMRAADQQPLDFKVLLQNQEKAMAEMASPMSDDDRQILQKNLSLVGELDPEEAAAIQRLNRLRLLVGLSPLEIDLKLCSAARDHSKDMVEKNFFSHTSPVSGKANFGDRARNFDTTASAENIYYGSTEGDAAIRAWFYSPGHHRNMFGQHRRVAVGRHQSKFTQMFGR